MNIRDRLLRPASVASAVLLVLLASACGSKPPPHPPPPVVAPAAPPVASAAAAGDTPPEDESPIPVTRDDPSWGSRKALVTIVEFADFQCPYCAKVAPTIDKLKETYGPTDLRVVYKHLPLPFHPHARPAAEAAQAAFALGGNDGFWRFYAKAYATNPLPDSFDDWAGPLGIDAASFKAGMASHRWAQPVEDDLALAQKLGVNGTPHFFVNGVVLSGAQPLDKFTKVVDEAMVQAKAAMEKGVPREYLYVVSSEFNLKHAPKEEEEEEPPPDETTAWRVPVGTSPSRGPATAPVTIVEFSDFQCPYCGRVEKTLDELRTSYGDRIRLVWKNQPLPFHPHAEPAAELAYEARAEKGETGFWDAHDRLFADQAHLEDADLVALARAMHLDAAKAEAAIQKHRYRSTLEADSDIADDLSAAGTPTFFINGRRVVGAQPIEHFRKIIDEEEAKAKSLYAEIQKQAKGPPEPDRKEVAVDPHAPSQGPVSAPIVIQEFADFQCPFCSRVEPTLKQALESYPGKVRIVWRNLPLPFHADAGLAAEAAMEAYAEKGNAGFWEMHDKLFKNQGTADGLKRPALEAYAKQIGLDPAKFAKALDETSHKAAIEADSKVAKDAEISGTPSFVINGYFVSGAQPFARFRRLIDRALAEPHAPRH